MAVSARGGKLYRVLAVLLATTSFLLIAELAFRLFFSVSDIPYWTGDPVLGYRHQIHRSGIFVTREHRARFHLNGRGWNNASEYSAGRRSGVPRIALLGDSYVEGLQVDFDRGVGAELQRLLSERLGPVEVYTYGISGASTAYAHDLLSQEVLGDRPDCIVYLFINNDVPDSVPRLGQGWGPLYDLDGQGRLRRIPPALYRPASWRRALSVTALFRYFWINRGLGAAWESGRAYDWLRARSSPENVEEDAIYQEPSPAWQQAWEIVGMLLGEMSARSAAAGADFLVVNRPHPAEFYGPKPSGSIHLPESILRDLASRHSFAFEDLGRSFDLDWKSRGERFDFEYDSHWNEHGHQVAAEALAAILTPMLARSSGRRALEGASP